MPIASQLDIFNDSSSLYPVPIPNPDAPTSFSVAAFPHPIATQFVIVEFIGKSIPNPVPSVFFTTTLFQSQSLKGEKENPFPCATYPYPLLGSFEVSFESTIKSAKSAFSMYTFGCS